MKLYKLYFMIALLSFPLFSSLALDCPSTLTIKDKALEFIRLDLSGTRLEEMEGKSCLDQKKFPYLISSSDYSNDEVWKAYGFVGSMKDVKIIKIKLLNPRTLTYKASFSVRVKKVVKNKKVINVEKDSISFSLYDSKKNHSIYGCGGITEYPQKIYLLEKCRQSR